MDKNSFFQEHWVTIEQDRMARYEDMFVFRAHQEPLLTSLKLDQGMSVADYGCGPGFMAMEIARRVGPTGNVYGLDINHLFLERAARRCHDEGITHLQFSHLDRASLAAHSLDRLFCKNVLEYVPDLQKTLAEQFNLLRPGGLIEIIDSDWGFVIVEPWGEKITREFFAAAAPAFKEPHIGRKLYAALKQAGYENINIQISATADTSGSGISIIKNMASYAQQFNTLPEQQLRQMIAELEQAIINKTYCFVLPQFVITAIKPEYISL
jgi:ubiquinone/menaquinone biosynthesis C-methylase UbiE